MDAGRAQLQRVSSVFQQWDAPTTDSWAPSSRLANNPSTRNVRKRHSFFGRSNSDVMAAQSTPTLCSIVPKESNTGQPSLQRPTTGMSGESRRRKTDPLDTIRNSIFGGRRKPSVANLADQSSYASRPSSRNGTEGASILARGQFKDEGEYYRHLRKQSISPPFNFEHITHTGSHAGDELATSNVLTGKKQLPPLETVDEKDLTAKFWAASGHQRPRRHLQGIKADNLDEKHRMMGITRGSPHSRPTSPVPNASPANDERRSAALQDGKNASIDGALFDDRRDTVIDSEEAQESLAPIKTSSKHPKRYSSLGALDQQQQSFPPRDLPTFYESNSSVESIVASELEQSTSPAPRDVSPPLDSVLEEPEPTNARHSLRSAPPSLPLPPLPAQALQQQISKASMQSSRPGSVSMPSLTSTAERTQSIKSKRSSRSARKSPHTPSTTDVRRGSILSDATWEDDVDYLYEQEAEATCDFDWKTATPARQSSIAESDGGVRLSAWFAPSPATKSESSCVLKPNRSSDDIAKHPANVDLQSQVSRGSSVGHRGFLAARRGSTELSRKINYSPATLEIPSRSTQVSILSPVFSVTGADDETTKTPITPGTLHFLGFAGGNGSSAEYLSDPESVRTGGSKHRKSSSYGSYESVARPGAAPPHRETARWSVASSNSVPDLMHSKRKSRSSLHKSIISRPLESLPQSPDKRDDGAEESTIVPRAAQIEPMRNTFVIRRAEVEPTAPQAANPAVQGGRAPTPSRFTRLLQPDEAARIQKERVGNWI